MNVSLWTKLTILVVFLSCGKTPTSQLGSLENFAAGKRVLQNQCFGDPTRRPSELAIAGAQRIVNLRSDLTTPVLQRSLATLHAVPDAALNFFLRRRGSIIATDDVAGLCSSANLTFEPGQLASCVNYFAPSAQNKEILHLIISSNFSELSHGLVRALGSAITQVLPGANPATRDGMGAFQEELALAFLRDVAESKVFAFDGIEMFLGEVSANVKTQLFAKRPSRELLELFDFGAKKPGERPTLRTRFLDFVFSEAFDSFYCNAFGTFDDSKAKAVAAGQASLSELEDLTNTRLRMKTLFPRTFETFRSGITRVLWMADNDEMLMRSGNQAAAGGFALAGPQGGQRLRYYRGDADTGNTFTAAAGAFFYSIYSNTAQPAVNGYQRYSSRVSTAVQSAYDEGSGFSGAVAKGVTSGVKNSYKEEVYDPIAQRTEKRFQGQLDSGASINQAYYNTLGLAVGDQVGATKIAEGIGGADTEQVRELSTGERVMKGIEGGVDAFGAVTTVSGFLPSQRALIAARSTSTGIASRAGQLEYKAVNEANETLILNQLKNSNAPQDYISKISTTVPGRESRLTTYAAAMADDVAPSTIKKGQTVWRVVEGEVKDASDPRIFKAWASDVPPDPRLMASQQTRQQISGNLGLPDNSGNFTLVKMTAVEDVPTLSSTIAPFKTNAGTIASGGAPQQFILKEPSTIQGAFRVEAIGDNAVQQAQAQLNQQITKQTAVGAVAGSEVRADDAAIASAAGSGLNLTDTNFDEQQRLELESLNETTKEIDESVKLDEISDSQNADTQKVSDSDEPIATVTQVNGPVFYGSVPLFAGQRIYRRDLLKVGANGNVRMKLIAEEAEVLGKDGAWIALGSAKIQAAHKVLRGQVRWRRAKDAQSALPIRVLTAQEAYTGVGTDFIVTASPDLKETEVVVFEGTVDAKSRNGGGHKLATGQWGGAGGRFTGKDFKGPMQLSAPTLKRLQR
jgi:hypothetical protein